MRPLLNYLNKWRGRSLSLNEAAIIIGIFTLLTKLVSIVKVNVLARTFAAGDVSDIYFSAFRIPDLLVNVLILGTLSVALIPVLSETIIKDKEEARALVTTLFFYATGTVFVFGVLIFIFMKPLTSLVVPGFSPDKLQQTVNLSRLLLITPILFTASSVFTSVLTVYRRFFIASMVPILYNFGIIFGVTVLYPRFGLYGLGVGVILGAILHATVQMFAVFNLGFLPAKILSLRNPKLIKIGKLFMPRLLAFDASQVSLIVGSVFASYLSAGSVAVFNFSYDLQSVPIGIFALSIAAASFPVLAELSAEKNYKQLIQTLSSAALEITYYLIPISIAFLVFRAYIVRLLLGYGKFDWSDTIATFQVLGILCISLLAQGLIPLFSKGFFALQDTKKPLLIALFSLLVNVVVSFFASKSLGILGIGIGFVVTVGVQVFLLFVFLRKEIINRSGEEDLDAEFDNKILSSVIKICLASAVAGIVSYFGLRVFEVFVDTQKVLGLLIQTGLSGALGALVYLQFGNVLGIEQAVKLMNFTKTKLSFFVPKE